MPSPECNVDVDLGEPPPEVLEYARTHCGEDPNTRLKAIYELRDMIYERGECTPHRMDDKFLVKFLRARNFIPAKAHRLMVNYYQFKENNPDFFDNIYPLDLQQIGEANIIAVPPYRDQNDRRLIMFRIGCWDPKEISVPDMFKGMILALEVGSFEPRTQILGGVAIVDLEDIGTQHAWQATPAVAAKIVKMLVTSFPMVTYAIHIINHSWIFDKIYSIFKPFLTTDMQSKIYFHGYDVTSLHRYVHPEHLPKRYGGIWQDYPYTIWLECLRNNYELAKEILASGYKLRENEISPELLRRLNENGIKLS
ncbi:alpha-tocopherol transfer protein-like [Hyposmocoma kahamanoa]|uniref:alpha-tocopherol transfer protein-like n=1 Tax=Hyposmocoma kahamanoa TaxID=1477025 RepID=UPI000E6D5DB6|nr:alpha-tocopherol transfer protein-like [Hyposmocoma kahamanoa]